MSWHFSRALVEAYLPASSLDGQPYAPWKLMPSAPDDSCSAKMKGTCHHSPFGMMFLPSTDPHGAGLLMLFRADFPVQTYPRPERKPVSRVTPAAFGATWQELFATYDRASRSWKIPQLSLIEESTSCSVTWPRWGFMQDGECWDQTMLAPFTPAPGAGSWPTPCHGSSHWGGTFQEAGGSQNKLRGTPTGKLYVNPDFWESLLGWPIGWTGTAPLETAKTQEWLLLHSRS